MPEALEEMIIEDAEQVSSSSSRIPVQSRTFTRSIRSARSVAHRYRRGISGHRPHLRHIPVGNLQDALTRENLLKALRDREHEIRKYLNSLGEKRAENLRDRLKYWWLIGN